MKNKVKYIFMTVVLKWILYSAVVNSVCSHPSRDRPGVCRAGELKV